MKRTLPFIIVCVSVVVFAAVGPMIGEPHEQVGMLDDATPVAVEALN